jgi:hypothetical protein
MQSLLRATNGFQPSEGGNRIASYVSDLHRFSITLSNEDLPLDILEQLAEIPSAAARCLETRFPAGESDLLSLLRVVDFRTYVGRSVYSLQSSQEGVTEVKSIVKLLNKKQHEVTGSQFWSRVPYIDEAFTKQVCLPIAIIVLAFSVNTLYFMDPVGKYASSACKCTSKLMNTEVSQCTKNFFCRS